MTPRPLIALAALAVLAVSLSASAQTPSLPLKGILGRASDEAIDKLSKPGAFAADSAVRTSLPGPSGGISAMMKMTGGMGLAGVTDSLNAAAGQAASAAKLSALGDQRRWAG